MFHDDGFQYYSSRLVAFAPLRCLLLLHLNLSRVSLLVPDPPPSPVPKYPIAITRRPLQVVNILNPPPLHQPPLTPDDLEGRRKLRAVRPLKVREAIPHSHPPRELVVSVHARVVAGVKEAHHVRLRQVDAVV